MRFGDGMVDVSQLAAGKKSPSFTLLYYYSVHLLALDASCGVKNGICM